ncbi:SIMPL domain-containing protein [Actinomadura bangladeshensis]|uniref:SIMPL domain-containing protein n=1 Tax=Actinomadura bangladeshensis TaxID=453573 RepID=A0A6L9QJ05_9ACTN|nr:SIMPL domain-containing protein [Actinomadura bangladeshensis]NEA24653.1 SIMPL domain-containing protein [Actinomadura bangladeshensis]
MDAPLISVRGEAVLEAEPEVARLSVHVQSQESDRRAALDRLTERNQRCLDLVRSYGDAVEKVETGGLAITPLLKYKRREGDVRAYRGTVWIKIAVVDFAVLGELVTRLGDLERTFVSGPEWELRRDSEVYERAARQAVHEAVTRARGYAEALGARLTGLVELSDEGLSRTPDSPVALAAAYGRAPGGAAEEPEPIDLEPETQIVRATVEARFTATQPDLEPR